MFTLIENGEVFAPVSRGRCSVLLAYDRIVKIGDISLGDVKALGVDVETVDASGCYVTPGLIDAHQHLTRVVALHTQTPLDLLPPREHCRIARI